MSAMPARLESLRDDSIHAPRFQPERFVHRRSSRENLRARVANSGEQLGRGQAKMKAHHRRAKFFEDVSGLRGERAALRRGTGRFRIDAELAIIRLKRLA